MILLVVREGVDPSTSGFQTGAFNLLTWGVVIASPRGVRMAWRSKGLDDPAGDIDTTLRPVDRADGRRQ